MKKSKIILSWMIVCIIVGTLLLGYIGKGYATNVLDDYVFIGTLLLYGAILLYEKYQHLRYNNSDEFIEMD